MQKLEGRYIWAAHISEASCSIQYPVTAGSARPYCCYVERVPPTLLATADLLHPAAEQRPSLRLLYLLGLRHVCIPLERLEGSTHDRRGGSGSAVRLPADDDTRMACFWTHPSNGRVSECSERTRYGAELHRCTKCIICTGATDRVQGIVCREKEIKIETEPRLERVNTST